jgi:hypothetical protein
MGKGREFLDVDVEWISLVFTPKMPANRVPVTVARMDGVGDGDAFNMIVARVAGFDPDDATFDRVVPITRTDSGIRTVYGIIYRKNEADTAETWARKETVRRMMERFMSRGLVQKIEANHDDRKVPDCFMSECWIVQRNDPRFPDPRDEDAWAGGVKINNPKVWDRVERGECTGFSLRGMAEMTKDYVDIPSEVAATADTIRGEVSRPEVSGEPAKGRGTVVQVLLFSKEKFSVTEAKKWAKDHGYKTGGVDNPEGGAFIHIRQFNPRDFKKGAMGDGGDFATIELTDGVKARIGKPKRATQRTDDGAVKENDEMDTLKGTAGAAVQEPAQKSLLARALTRAGEIMGVSRSEFSDALKSEQGTKRISDLWCLLCDAYWKIIGSAEAIDKEGAIIECVDDFAAAVENGTEVQRATIRHAARIKDGTPEDIDGQMAAVRRSVEVARIAAGAQGTDNKEGADMEQKQIQEMIETSLTAAVKRIGEEFDKKIEALKPKAPDGTAAAPVAPAAAPETLAPAVEARIAAAEAKATAAEAKVVELTQKVADAAAPKGPDAEKIALVEQVKRSEESLATLKGQVEKSEKELGEAKDRLSRLEGKRPAARADAGSQDTPTAPPAAPKVELKPGKGLPKGQIV